MAVLMVKVYDRHQRIQLPPQSAQTHEYPVLATGCSQEIHGQELIERWVNVIKTKAAGPK